MIYTEMDKNKVIFSNLFARHYPKLFDQLKDILHSYHKGCGALSHTKDYWVRDFMPVQTAGNTFAKFIYDPDYLKEQRNYITDVDKVLERSTALQRYTIINVPLVADGGNMVFCKGRKHMIDTYYLVMTEKVLVENPQYDKKQIESFLRRAYQEPRLTIVWLPWDKEDAFGHTDGIVRYIGFNKEGKPRVLVNLELYEDDIAAKMHSSLTEYFEVINLQLSQYDEMSWAYINCLQTENVIIIPGIGNPRTDAEALTQYKQLFPQYEGNIYQVQMRDFVAENGGALNCCTWTIKDNGYWTPAQESHIRMIDIEDLEEAPF